MPFPLVSKMHSDGFIWKVGHTLSLSYAFKVKKKSTYIFLIKYTCSILPCVQVKTKATDYIAREKPSVSSKEGEKASFSDINLYFSHKEKQALETLLSKLNLNKNIKN